MSEYNIEVQGGSSVRLLTAGKYCDRNIVVNAVGGGGGTSPFKWLDYIETSGTQYIDTGFKHNNNTRVVTAIQLTEQPTAIVWVFDGRHANFSCRKGVLFQYGISDKWVGDYSNSQRLQFSAGVMDKLLIDFNKNVCTINGEIQTFNVETFQSSYNLLLLAANTGGTVGGIAKAKLWETQIYDNGTLIRHFKPCQIGNDIGMWDIVGNKFYGNAGTGSFTGA